MRLLLHACRSTFYIYTEAHICICVFTYTYINTQKYDILYTTSRKSVRSSLVHASTAWWPQHYIKRFWTYIHPWLDQEQMVDIIHTWLYGTPCNCINVCIRTCILPDMYACIRVAKIAILKRLSLPRFRLCTAPNDAARCKLVISIACAYVHVHKVHERTCAFTWTYTHFICAIGSYQCACAHKATCESVLALSKSSVIYTA